MDKNREKTKERIKSIKYLNEERLHDSNPKYWNRSAPLLFPNIGCTEAHFNGIKTNLPKHGFLRNTETNLDSIENDSITFSFISIKEVNVVETSSRVSIKSLDGPTI